MVRLDRWRAMTWAVVLSAVGAVALQAVLMAAYALGGPGTAPHAAAAALAMGAGAPKVTAGPGIKCGFWAVSDLHCVVVMAQEELMSRPELLGRAVDGIRRPCRYLPGPDQWASLPETEARRAEKQWKGGQCARFPDQYPGRIILIFHDRTGFPVLTWKKHGDLGAWTLLREYWGI